ncbi:MAG: hypothetical protein R3B13_20180 [Polyangiaceae bacterium]
MKDWMARGIRILLMLSFFGVAAFKGDACICGGGKNRPRPAAPPASNEPPVQPPG